ncbi:unnamed protein product [Calicophoron daubneyi]
MRKIFYLMAKKYSLGFASLQCRCSVDQCVAFNALRPSPVPEEIIRLMSSKIEWPDIKSNRWEKHTFIVDMSLPLSFEVVKEIMNFLGLVSTQPYSHVEELEEIAHRENDQSVNANSIIHAVDNHLRGAVGEFMLSHDNAWKKRHSALMQNLKSETLMEIKAKIPGRSSPDIRSKLCDEAVSLFRHKLLSRNLE